MGKAKPKLWENKGMTLLHEEPQLNQISFC